VIALGASRWKRFGRQQSRCTPRQAVKVQNRRTNHVHQCDQRNENLLFVLKATPFEVIGCASTLGDTAPARTRRAAGIRDPAPRWRALLQKRPARLIEYAYVRERTRQAQGRQRRLQRVRYAAIPQTGARPALKGRIDPTNPIVCSEELLGARERRQTTGDLCECGFRESA